MMGWVKDVAGWNQDFFDAIGLGANDDPVGKIASANQNAFDFMGLGAEDLGYDTSSKHNPIGDLFGWMKNATFNGIDAVGGIDDRLKQILLDGADGLQNMKNNPRQAPRRQLGKAAPVSPYQILMERMMAGGGGSSANSQRDNQKLINNMILQARAPFDAEIAGTRQDFGNAIKDTDRYAAGLMAPLESAKGSAKARQRAQTKVANQQAAQQTQQIDKAAQQAAAELGIDSLGGTAHQGVAQADDLAKAGVGASRASRVHELARQTRADTTRASEMQDWAKADAAESKNMLRRQSVRRVGDLRGQRAQAIAQGRAQGQSAVSSMAAQQQEAQDKQLGLMLELIKAQTADAFRGQEMDLKRQEMMMEAQRPDLEAYRLINQMGTATTQGTQVGKDGKPYTVHSPAYRPEVVLAMAQQLGIDPSILMAGQEPAAAGDGESVWGDIKGWLKGLGN